MLALSPKPRYSIYRNALGLFIKQSPDIQGLFAVEHTETLAHHRAAITVRLSVQFRLENQHLDPFDTGYPVLIVEMCISTWNPKKKNCVTNSTNKEELHGKNQCPRVLERDFQDFVFSAKDEIVELLNGGLEAEEIADKVLMDLDQENDCVMLFPWLESQAQARQQLMETYIFSPPV